MAVTKLQDLINPQVMADMISAKLPKKIVVSPFAKIDNTLQGTPGNTITVPAFNYIGDAADVAEGVAVTPAAMSVTSTTATIKKAMKAVDLTDEAVLSGFGNPIGEATNQLSKSIAAKIDGDCMDELLKATLFSNAGAKISYNTIVEAIDVFEEEFNTEKVIFINPKQVGILRKDPNYVASEKIKDEVIVTGAIGKIANCLVVPSKRVPEFSTWYKPTTSGTTGAVEVVASGASTGEVNLTAVVESLPNAKVGDYVLAVSTAAYFCPIVKLNRDDETEDESAALTIYLKRDVNVETERDTLSRKTAISVDEFYTAALSDASKVVLAKFDKA